MSSENSSDEKIKSNLIKDAIALVNPMCFDRESLYSLLRRRMKTSQWSSKMPRSRLELRQQINLVFAQILKGQRPQDTSGKTKLGDFRKIAPSSVSERLLASKSKIKASSYGSKIEMRPNQTKHNVQDLQKLFKAMECLNTSLLVVS
ncbi:hypothetical protein AAMO2058_001126100 [Amorphochlora amoebiformis]